ncbi:DUF2510 domain-containing protein [Streptomyces sp. V4-01]|uniref:DUF2510 domain-containing protein n=1 Tax=Actinacidiphila polyblastidii TaxID=3110430 RepID=A0ABU7PB09_9ACTN|nr:DUF2510 domain-containing protein [Streptomyces sp. V4-01]
MTTTTPPGWYPEPGHTGNSPAMERWWDGSAWTEYTRTAPAPNPAQPAYPGYPAYPAYPSGDVITSPGGGARRNNRNVVIAIVVALVLIGGVVAGVLALGKGKNDDASSQQPPAPAASGTPRQGGPQTRPTDPGLPQDPGTQDPGTRGDSTKAVDAYDGISLPVLDGWQGSSGASGIGSSVVTSEYACPGDASKSCVRGGVFAQPAAALQIKATGAEAAAKADIAPNAANSYSPEIYGATTSHQQLASKAVTVAGQRGYLVRWKVVTKSGTGGYVESLAFPSPSGSGKIVVVRFGFDVDPKAPGLDVMDQIADGIKADSSGGTSGAGV